VSLTRPVNAVYGKVVFYESNTAIFIFWQIFSGLALVTASVMAAAFFRTRRISGVFAAICFTCLAGGAAVILNRRVDTARVVVLAIMFPSMNYIFALAQMARYITISQPVHLSKAPPALPLNSADWVVPNTFFVPIWAFWVISILHIAIYPLLAIWAERWMHGISFKGRVLSDAATTGSLDPDIAVRTEGLTKVYPTVWYKKIFRVDDGTGRVALSNLDLVARNTQIVCLLGVNGAGKSTTLDLLSGFHTLTSGSMHIRARPSQLGVCPQKNVLFDRLTVLEHVRFWSQLKGAGEEENTLHALIEACDLSGKANIQARVLSGGQKRKLQLACMFVGDTKVCLMDEVTTGLDPISRRAIWNIILAERAKRSMIFTTHFLDEGEVLADHIVILSKGEIKCQGSGAELKTRFGGGYRVYLPQDADVSGVAIDEPRRIHQDHAVYRTPDSTSAARLVARLEAAGHSRVRVAGPTVEDVFLRVAEEDVLLTESDDGGRTDAATNEKSTATEDLTPGKPTTFWAQVRILLLKRWLILPRYWVGAFLVLALPIAGMPPINSFIALEFERPRCSQSGKESVYDQTRSLQMWMGLEGSQPAPKPFGPPSANETLYRVIMNFPIGGAPGNVSGLTVSKNWALQSDFESFRRFTENSPSAQGAVWMGDATSRPTIGNSASFVSSSYPLEVLRLYTSMASGVEISSAIRSVSRYFVSCAMLVNA
jgi:ATP-binding cassette subfamily A (ABC1) protein 3